MPKFTGTLTGNGQGSDDRFRAVVTISQGSLQMILHENSAGKIHGTYSYHATETVSGTFLHFVDSVTGYGDVHGHGSRLILTETDPAGVFSIATGTIRGGTITYAASLSVQDGGFSASGELSGTLSGHGLTTDRTETVGSFDAAGHGGATTTSVEPSLNLTHL